MPCFGRYWSKYVYSDIAAHVAGDKADIDRYTMAGPGCEYWLRHAGVPLPNGTQPAQDAALAALRELRQIVNAVLESGRHSGLEKARKEMRVKPLTVYDAQTQACETKRGFRLPARIAEKREKLWTQEARKGEEKRRAVEEKKSEKPAKRIRTNSRTSKSASSSPTASTTASDAGPLLGGFEKLSSSACSCEQK